MDAPAATEEMSTHDVVQLRGAAEEAEKLREIGTLVIPITSQLPSKNATDKSSPGKQSNSSEVRRALEAVLPLGRCHTLELRAHEKFQPFEMQSYVQALARAVGTLRSAATTLRCRQVPLDNVSWCFLVQCVGALPELAKVELVESQLDDYFGDCLGAQLLRAPKLSRLHLAGNRLGSAAGVRVGWALQMS